MCTRHLLRVALCCPQDSLPRICNLCERHSIPLGCFLPQRYSCRSLHLDNPGGAAGLPAHCLPAFCARVLEQRQRLTSVSSSVTLRLIIWDKSLSILGLANLARKPWGSSCLYLPSTRITGTHHHTQFSGSGYLHSGPRGCTTIS